ncbi:MAG TPA: DUF2163 domain-containing protein [Novosphingobium sp.]|jgi:uncharacterized phage protein (TIGR02218 family)|nr:DUF2163 domain-containing protein [Novosphingobium sp.]
MKNLSGGLQAHLDSGTTTLCWCWKLVRQDGVVLGFTDHDLGLSFAGVDFEPESGFTASEIRAGSELSVDAQDASGGLSSDRITETDIIDGLYDAAEVEVWRVNWQAVSQRVLLRRGVIGQIRRGVAAFSAEMRSLAHVLDQSVGRSYQYSCDRALGDSRCRVNLANPAFRGTGAVIGLVRERAFSASGLGGFAAGWFANGILTWTSGANSGRQAEVMTHMVEGGVAVITLLEAPVRAIEDGDAFAVTVGCDKTSAQCHARFANILNFRGFPHIPGQDTVIRYAKRSNANTGAPLGGILGG